jgi:hypothetical protein
MPMDSRSRKSSAYLGVGEQLSLKPGINLGARPGTGPVVQGTTGRSRLMIAIYPRNGARPFHDGYREVQREVSQALFNKAKPLGASPRAPLELIDEDQL